MISRWTIDCVHDERQPEPNIDGGGLRRIVVQEFELVTLKCDLERRHCGCGNKLIKKHAFEVGMIDT